MKDFENYAMGANEKSGDTMLRAINARYTSARIKASAAKWDAKCKTKGFLRRHCETARTARQFLDAYVKAKAIDTKHSGVSVRTAFVKQITPTGCSVELSNGRVWHIPGSHFLMRPDLGDTVALVRIALDDRTFLEGAVAMNTRLADAMGLHPQSNVIYLKDILGKNS